MLKGDQCLVQFLMALHHDFKGLRGLVMHLDPLPSVDSVMSDLLAEDILLKSYDDMKIIGPSVLASTHHTTTSYGTQNRPHFQPQALATSSGNGLSSSHIVFSKWVLDSSASHDMGHLLS
ncbi:hypothetical protein Tco_0532100 [Tanacetum coccineum]